MSSAVVLERPAAPVVAAQSSTDTRLRLSCVSWDQYNEMREALGDRPVRMTYDRGELEIMVTSAEHETYKSLLRRLLEALTLELKLEIRCLGNTTLRMKGAEQGLEADECWYIQHESDVRGKKAIDLSVDPPPDLALEVEVSRSALDRLGIYLAMGVPEIWRYDGSQLRIHVLKRKRYEEVNKSPTFPTIPLTFLTDALGQFGKAGENQIVTEFIERVRATQRRES